MTEQKCIICGLPESLRDLDRTQTHHCFYTEDCAHGIAYKLYQAQVIEFLKLEKALHNKEYREELSESLGLDVNKTNWEKSLKKVKDKMLLDALKLPFIKEKAFRKKKASRKKK